MVIREPTLGSIKKITYDLRGGGHRFCDKALQTFEGSGGSEASVM